MKSLGDLNLSRLIGMDDDSSRGKIPPGSNNNDPKPCRTCGMLEMFCNGSGFYDLDVPVGHPDFSKVFRCPNNPVEQDTERQAKLRRLSNLDAFSDKRFETFILSGSGMSAGAFRSLEQAFNVAQMFAQNPNGKWVVFEGTYGCGKTHLAAAIGNVRLSMGDAVLFVTAPDLLDHLRRSFAPNSEAGYDETFDRVRRSDLLILDDLGVENPSAWAQEKLFQLLNYRYNEKLPTVITTNADVDKLDPRLRSRMLDADIVRRVGITAPDYRSAQQNERSQLSDLHLYQNFRFEEFDTRRGCLPDEAQNLNRALAVAMEFAQRPDGWLVIIGNSGTGKTHLAAAIAAFQQQAGRTVMFVTAPDLLDYLRRTFNPDSTVSFDDQFQRVRDAAILVLDDLGAVNHNRSWVREKLLQLVKYRYVKRLPTVFTTTQSLEEMDDQIRTRLKDRRLCRIIGISARPYVDRTYGGVEQ